MPLHLIFFLIFLSNFQQVVSTAAYWIRCVLYGFLLVLFKFEKLPIQLILEFVFQLYDWMPFQNLSNDLSFNGFASFTVNKTMMLKYKVHTVVILNHSPHRDTRRFPENFYHFYNNYLLWCHLTILITIFIRWYSLWVRFDRYNDHVKGLPRN